jgi:lipoate-protein ligase A
MGVDCRFEGRNDLVIDGMKFSGNAQLIEKDRVLHHGTLLFSAQMADLSGALRANPAKFEDKAVKSVQKRVTNISAHLPEPMDVEAFIARVMDFVSGGASGEALGLRPEEEAGIEELKQAKYATWDWNFGASPDYGFTRCKKTPGGQVEAHLDVHQGRIRAARIFGDFFGVRPVRELETLLCGRRHERGDIRDALTGTDMNEFIRGVDIETFLDCLF